MRIVHCADLHIGYSAYQRLTRAGINAREHDVGSTLTRLVDAIIAVAPDAVVIAGDVFHSARPSNHAIVHAYAQFSRMVAALPNAPIVIAAGNHDLSKTVASGSILQLFARIGVHVADRSAMRFAFPSMGLSVLAVPDVAGLARPELVPDAGHQYNVLCLHGDAQGVTQGGADRRVSLESISPAEMNADAWNYVALGHYHQYEQIAPNVFYSGSIDFTSSNPWQEIATPKGFVVRDLATGEHTFHELTPGRRFIDVPRIYAADLTPAEIDARIREAVDACAIDDAVVRLVVHDVERDIARALDHKALREYGARALNFNFDFRRPAPATVARGDLSAAEIGKLRRKSMHERLREKLETFGIGADVDRGQLVALGGRYLDAAIADSEPSDSLEQQLRDSIAIQTALEKSA